MTTPSQNRFQSLSQSPKLNSSLNDTQLDIHLPQPNLKWARNYGNTIPLKFDQQTGQAKYLLGPHYCISIWTILITSFIDWFLIFKLNQEGAHFLFTILNIFAYIIYLYSYVKVTISIPGIASTGMQPDYQTKMNSRYCTPCKIIRNKTTRHCLMCDVCIQGYDHHCPWIGKCVGSGNLNAFRMFLCCVSLLIIMLFVTVVLGLSVKPPVN